jgi:beta-lactamase class A
MTFADPLTDTFVALGNRFNARLGVFAADLNSPRVAAYRGGERWAMCSTFKGYAAGRVLQMVDRGQTRLDTAVPGDYGTTNDVGVVYGPDGQRFALAVPSQSGSEDPQAPALNELVAQATSTALASLTA